MRDSSETFYADRNLFFVDELQRVLAVCCNSLVAFRAARATAAEAQAVAAFLMRLS